MGAPIPTVGATWTSRRSWPRYVVIGVVATTVVFLFLAIAFFALFLSGEREPWLPIAAAVLLFVGALMGRIWTRELRHPAPTWTIGKDGVERVRGTERRVVAWRQIRSVRAVCRDRRTLEGHVELDLGSGFLLRSSAHAEGGSVVLYRSTLFLMDVPDARRTADLIEARAGKGSRT